MACQSGDRALHAHDDEDDGDGREVVAVGRGQGKSAGIFLYKKCKMDVHALHFVPMEAGGKGDLPLRASVGRA